MRERVAWGLPSAAPVAAESLATHRDGVGKGGRRGYRRRRDEARARASMSRGLRSIRGKLAALVVVPVLLMLVVLGAMERILERQLVGEAERHAETARRSLQVELDDALRDLRVALLQLSGSQRFWRVLGEGDLARATEQAQRFSDAYPGIAVLVAGPSDEILIRVGLEGVARLEDIPGLMMPAGDDDVAKTLVPGGCDARDKEAPSRVLVTRVEGSGTIVVCQRLDAAFLEHAAAKLGMALALADERDGPHVLAHTEDFPIEAPHPEREQHLVHEVASAAWAIDRFCPTLLPDPADPCALEVLTAISVTETRDIVRSDLFLVMGIVLGTGLLALLVGGRIALRMTSAIDRIVGACRRLGKQEYTRIDPVRTGDELEELGERFNEMVRGLEERDRLRTTFGKYMTESVVSHLLENKVRLGGDILPVTVLFSDIRGFTATSERLDAQSVVALLNEYFAEMVETVMDHGGVVDKYIGDAIMVVFGAPVPREDDAIQAVRAAIKMRGALARLNDRLEARGLAPIRTGIGIHSGDVVAGNIGCERRMEYTVIGDAVNLASRLEGCTKDFDADVLISEATYELVRDAIDATLLRTITVKGREQPVKVYGVAVPETAALHPVAED